jgi:hypothetical protein
MRKFIVNLLMLTVLLGVHACSRSSRLNAKGGATGESSHQARGRPDIDTGKTGGIQDPGPGWSDQPRRRRRR